MFVCVCVFVCVRVCASAAYNADLILAWTQLVYLYFVVLIYGNLAFSALYFSSFLWSVTFSYDLAFMFILKLQVGMYTSAFCSTSQRVSSNPLL